MKQTVESLKAMKNSYPISMITAYDYPLAKIVDNTDIDVILVGDSLGTNVLGYDSVFDVTMKDMIHHTSAVSRGSSNKFILVDLPYETYKHVRDAQNNAARLIGAGAEAVKMESELEAIDKIAHVVNNGIPVCGHIGYTPQTPGLKTEVQGKDLKRAEELIKLAKLCEEAGAFMIVLELIPRSLAKIISDSISIPTIGIGAGGACDGQVQVMPDILGISERIFKHAKSYGNIKKQIVDAIENYSIEVKNGSFPLSDNSIDIPEEMVAEIIYKKRDK